MAKNNRKPVRFNDPRGKSWFDVFPWFDKAQVNFSILYPGAVKAFHRHQKQEDWIVCVFGDIRVILKGEEQEEFCLSQGDAIRIPVNTWHGFTALNSKEAGMVYLCTQLFDSKDEERTEWDTFSTWEVDNK